MSVCMLLTVVVVILVIVFFTSRSTPRFSLSQRVWVTMTTTPERLVDPWFERTLCRSMDMCKSIGATLLLQVPFTSHRGVSYTVPDSVAHRESATFQIRRHALDEGPITKLLPSLRDDLIQDDDIIIVCDDDIVHRDDVFRLLVDSVENNSSAVSCMCTRKTQGYAGFAFRKRVLKDLRDVQIPASCFKVDDDVIFWFVRARIPTMAVSYYGDVSWTCSLLQKETDTHPK